jgi:hypothetical protein
MIVGVRPEGMDERHLVHMTGQVRKQLRDPFPTLPVLPPAEGGLHEWSHLLIEKSGIRIETGEFLPIAFFEFRLVIPGIDVGRPAVHEEPNDSLSFRGEMGLFWG